MMISLFQKMDFGILLSFTDDRIIRWKLDAIDIDVVGFIGVRSILKDFTRVDRDSRPSILGEFLGAHGGLKCWAQWLVNF